MEILYNDEKRDISRNKQDFKREIQTKNQIGFGLAEILIFISLISFFSISIFKISDAFNKRKQKNLNKFRKQWINLEKEY